MICPDCKAEYRPGFSRCADCDVELVYVLPSASASEESPGGELRRIWVGNHQNACVKLCLRLKDAGIPYKVAQDIKSRNMETGEIWKYELAVLASDEASAIELLGLPETLVQERNELEDLDEDQALLEYPDGGEAPAVERKRGSYLDPWYPEDATAEVWMQAPSDNSNMVSMAFKENLIRVRIDVQEEGSKKYFVLPEDEVLAREIVREIVEDSPAGSVD